MKFGVITGVKQAEVHEHALRDIRPDEVLINNKSCNICTTDYQQWSGARTHQPYPMAFGHENAGIAVKVGAEVTHVKEGDMVVSNIYSQCLVCGNCRRGLNAVFCLNRSAAVEKDDYGYYGGYGCADYQITPGKYVFTVKKTISFEEAGFVEPLSTVLHGLGRLRVKTGENLLVIGAGTMGTLNAVTAGYFGANVIISEVSDKKLQHSADMGFDRLIDARTDNMAEKIDAYTGGEGVDAVIIAVGAGAAYKQALEVSKSGSRLLIFASGYPAPQWDLDPNAVHYKLLEVIGTFGCNEGDYQTAADLLGSGRIDVSKLIETKYPLDDIQDGFAAANSGDAYRVSLLL
ncbi:MAG: zinc-binding dehydrogenase [Clostridiales Family XIII bacterium]|jgi:L-iditol 2-dehydrogenase|nr:zinc-binding dehydrogenase [Clostridiales Family XIII bacterium]